MVSERWVRRMSNIESIWAYVEKAVEEGRARREDGDRFFVGDLGPMSCWTAYEILKQNPKPGSLRG